MILYRLYTEGAPVLRESLKTLTLRYFKGATILYGVGLYDGAEETCAVIEVLGDDDDRQRIINLAGDIRIVNGQASVLVSWHSLSVFNVCEPLPLQLETVTEVYSDLHGV